MKKLIEDYGVIFLRQSDEAEQLAAVYIAEEAVKPSYPTDALHIAAATVYKLDFIVSLNFQHILRRKTMQPITRRYSQGSSKAAPSCAATFSAASAAQNGAWRRSRKG
jgi:hypothetical protein